MPINHFDLDFQNLNLYYQLMYHFSWLPAPGILTNLWNHIQFLRTN